MKRRDFLTTLFGLSLVPALPLVLQESLPEVPVEPKISELPKQPLFLQGATGSFFRDPCLGYEDLVAMLASLEVHDFIAAPPFAMQCIYRTKEEDTPRALYSDPHP